VYYNHPQSFLRAGAFSVSSFVSEGAEQCPVTFWNPLEGQSIHFTTSSSSEGLMLFRLSTCHLLRPLMLLHMSSPSSDVAAAFTSVLHSTAAFQSLPSSLLDHQSLMTLSLTPCRNGTAGHMSSSLWVHFFGHWQCHMTRYRSPYRSSSALIAPLQPLHYRLPVSLTQTLVLLDLPQNPWRPFFLGQPPLNSSQCLSWPLYFLDRPPTCASSLLD
jgi:hypothetical protein